MNEPVKLRDGTFAPSDRWVCHCSECSTHPGGPLFAEERYSFGIYAGKMCDAAWKRSGYRDDGPEGFDPDYAGERLEADY